MTDLMQIGNSKMLTPLEEKKTTTLHVITKEQWQELLDRIERLEEVVDKLGDIAYGVDD